MSCACKLITAESEQVHLHVLCEPLTHLEQCGVRADLAKRSFAQNSVGYMSHRVNAEGINPTYDKLKAITNIETPGDVNQLRSYLGLIHCYAKFVLRVFIVLRPIHQLLMKVRMWKRKYSRM